MSLQDRFPASQIIGDSLYRNSSHIILNTVATSGLGFFFWFIAAKFYAPEEVGLASALISSMVLLTILSSTGFRYGLMRFMPTSKEGEKMLNSCLSMVTIIAFLLALTFYLLRDVVAHVLAPTLEKPWFLLVFTVFTVTSSLTLLLDGAFIAGRAAKYVLFKNTTACAIRIPMPIFIVSLGGVSIFLAWGFSIAVLFIFFLLFFTSRVEQGYKPRFVIDMDIVRRITRFSMGNHLAGVFAASPGYVLPIMIANMLEPAMAAYFYVSWMIANLLYIVPVGTSYSLLAEASLEEGRTREKTMKSLRFIFALLLPGILVVVLLADRLLLLFGQEYTENAATLLRMLALSSAPLALNRVYITLKNIQKNVKAVVLINGAISLCTLLLSYFLIGYIGLLGAGIGWMIAQGMMAGLTLKVFSTK